jgi:hypothetical protein
VIEEPTKNKAKPPAELPDQCDASAELGVTLPGGPAGEISFREESGASVLICGGRELGRYARGKPPAPPAAFWPTMFAEMTTHPALYARVHQNGAPPAELETTFRTGTGWVVRQSWRLIRADSASTSYPLTDGMRNVTADGLDKLVAPGAARLTLDAMAGRALGGAPTAKSWGEHLEAVSKADGRAAAAMLLLPTANMFPDLPPCRSEPDQPYCRLAADLNDIEKTDPTPGALLEIGMAEQKNDLAGAIAAMQRAQRSPLKDHPALGASFALAAMRFDDKLLAQARAAGLPTGVRALQTRAVMALPYNPAYWTDIGDRYGGDYEWGQAFLFYDIAALLPMPGAVAKGVPASKRATFERVRRDFPDGFLPNP